ncbi:hypothetical protein HZC30_06315 [Candidatus Woesearchaeota archaeon]|nr:hypothetical protein [Candidatus Woesearchaeota archaeon]
MVKQKDVKSRSSRSYLGKGWYSKLAIIGAIIILIIGAFLFVNLKSVGKAIGDSCEFGKKEYTYCPDIGIVGSDGLGVYQEKTAIVSLKEGNCDSNEQKKSCPGFCNAGYCISNTAKYLDCFAPNSVIRLNDFDSLCQPLTGQQDPNNNYNWIDCEGEWKGTVISGNEKFYCGGDKKFYPCVTETDGTAYPKSSNKHLCVSKENKWVTCDDKLDKKDWLKLDGLFLCRGSYWDKCNVTKVSTTKVYYCSKDGDNKWKWKECTKAGLSADFKQLCQQEGTTWKWAVCGNTAATNKNKNSLDGKYYCDGSTWTTVGTTDLFVNGVKETCNATNIGTHAENSFKYCDGKEWKDCNDTTDHTFSSDGRALCSNGGWLSCTTGTHNKKALFYGSGPHGGEFLCDGEKETWITCDASTTPKLLFGSYSSSPDQFYCSYKGDHYQWQKCNSTKTTPDLISGDNTKICKSGNKWTAPAAF